MFAEYWPEQTVETQRIADALNATPKVVFSRTLERAPWGSWEDARVVAGSASEEIRRLKEEPGADMVVWGSLTLSESLERDGLVDEYRLFVCPVVLGLGRRLFGDGTPTRAAEAGRVEAVRRRRRCPLRGCRRCLAAVLELVPRRHGRELEQRSAAFRLGVAEVAGVVLPRDVEQPLLHAVVEPRAAEDELAQPVDERLVPHERQPLPVADEVEAEPAPRLDDAAVGDELDRSASSSPSRSFDSTSPSFTAAAVTRSPKSFALNSKRWPRNSTTKSSPER